MIFSSMLFLWIFLPFTLVGYYIISKIEKNGNNIGNLFLLIVSLISYAWGEPKYVFLMLFSIFVNYILGLIIEKVNRNKGIVLFIAVCFNLALLGMFKYTAMLVDMFNKVMRAELNAPAIALPIGISFFTFQILSYVIDVYRGECKAQKNLLKMALYVSFFPQLIAGPIVKYKDINEQIDCRKLNVDKFVEGIRRFCYGLGKKVLLSNALAMAVDSIYALDVKQVTGPMAWCASILYTLQIYYDFSGYSDMAIGLGKMFGFEFKENFNYPYISCSIKEFWRRWHISLSLWFREYVYIPLGGSRVGKGKTYRNLFIVFFLTGIWHGANYNFIFWGLFHGFFIILERIGFGKILDKNKIFGWLYTILIVNIGWVFFRIEDIKLAFSYIIRMLFPWQYVVSDFHIKEFVNPYIFFICICAILGTGGIQHLCIKNGVESKWKNSVLELVYCMVILIFSFFSLTSSTYNPFIYFRF